MDDNYYLVLDIGGIKCAVIAGNDNLKMLGKKSFPTNTRIGPDHLIGHLVEAEEELVQKFGMSALKAIGISCGGPIDSKKGIIKCGCYRKSMIIKLSHTLEHKLSSRHETQK
mgnify:CR=1 FL=1